MILGLDISTSCTGISVLDNKGNILLFDHVLLAKEKKDLYHKANIVKEFLNDLNKKFDIKYIFIEECLLRFRLGKSSIHTLMTLAKFNGVVGYICEDVFNIKPEYIPATHARKMCGISITKEEKKVKSIKQIILDKLQDKLQDKLVIDYTRNGNPKTYMFDRCDAYVIAMCGFLEQSQ